jgi:hypothetical protein
MAAVVAVVAVVVVISRATFATARKPPASLVDRLQWTRGPHPVATMRALPLVLLPPLLLLALLPLLPLLPLLLLPPLAVSMSRSLLMCRIV